jgi:GNAT superfamily N-acetyltransferase
VSFKIEPVQESDRQEIVALFGSDAEAQKIWGKDGGRVVWYWYWSQPAKKARKHWDKAVDVETGRILGCVHWVEHMNGWRTLKDIVVAPDARGQGVGRALVAQVGLPVYLKTDVDSLANGFYQRLGFTKGETMPSKKRTKMLTVYTMGEDPK